MRIQSVATLNRWTRWGNRRSVRRYQCRSDQLDTIACRQDRRVAHVAVDACIESIIGGDGCTGYW